MDPDTDAPAVVPADLSELLETAVEAAAAGADAALGCLARGPIVTETKTTGLDLVTAADRQAEAAILEVVRRRRPEDGFLGEEGSSVVTSSGVTWVVDPVDSTANLVRGLPMWSVSVAATSGDLNLAGCVAGPALDESFSAAQGLGLQVNGRAWVPERAPVDLEKSLGLVGWASGVHHPRRGELLEELISSTGRIRSPGSPALGLAWTAVGRADFAYYEQSFARWDVAAGLALCAEAELGIRLDWLGQGPHRLLVAREELFETLAELVFR